MTGLDFSLKARRSTRIPMRLPLQVAFRDKAGASHKVEAWTMVLNKHGARVECKRALELHQEIAVTVVPTKKSGQGSVVWREAKPNHKGHFECAVELIEAENLWGVEFPPNDWNARKAAGAAKQSPAALRDTVAAEPVNTAPESAPKRMPDPEPAPAVLMAEESAAEAVVAEQTLAALPEFPTEQAESTDVPVFEAMPEPEPQPLPKPEPQPEPASPVHLDLTSELPHAEPAPPRANAPNAPAAVPLLSRHMSSESFNATAAALLNALITLLEREGHLTRERLYEEMDRFNE